MVHFSCLYTTYPTSVYRWNIWRILVYNMYTTIYFAPYTCKSAFQPCTLVFQPVFQHLTCVYCIQTYTIQFRTFQRLATCPQPIVLFLKAQTKWRLTRWRNFGVDMTRKQCGIEAKVHGTHSERQHAPKKKTCKNQ